jgi:hypothetical protein
MIYTETQMENLSDNFKITKEQVYQIGQVFNPRDSNGNYIRTVQNRYHVIPYELIKETLKSYKQQLLDDKKKLIIDTHLKQIEISQTIDCLNLRSELGLSISKEGVVSLIKKERKSTATSTPKVNKGDINRNFKYSLQGYAAQHLGFTINLTVHTATLYNVLTAFKTLCPHASYSDLVTAGKNNFYWGVNEIKECEDMWNNPKLAKPKKKKPTKKEKKQ